jgi:predicted RNase H-like HicB family nuclease
VDVKRTFTIILEADETGGFAVHVPALPEVCTQGDAEADAIANAREAIELAVEERIASGEQIPEQDPQLRNVSVTFAYPTAARTRNCVGATPSAACNAQGSLSVGSRAATSS